MDMNKILRTRIFLVLAIAAVLVASAVKPPVKYWVKFTDKNGTPYSINQPSSFLTAKSIARRTSYNIPIHFSDLPVTPSYISQVSAVPSVKVLYASKWMNGVVISVDSIDKVPAVFATIKSFTFVSDTNKVQRYVLNTLEPGAEPLIEAQREAEVKGEVGSYNFGGSTLQNHQLNVDCYHEKGFRGQGMTIAVMDVGYAFLDLNPVFDSLRKNNGILGGRDFVSGGTNPYQGGTHGTNVMSCMAANIPGLILGSAPMAKYWLLRTEAPSENLIEEYNWIAAAEFADSVGADILTTSLGYTDFDDPRMNHNYGTLNGRTAPMSIAATMAARKGMFVLNAAGNEGANPWHFISVAADADSVCAVGAVDGDGKYALFSSVGPTSDGRIKPDLSARGAGSWISTDNAICYPANGTSFATPILAGAVACFWQAHRSYNNIKVLDTLKKCGSSAASPNNQVGWGMPQLPCAPAIPYTCVPTIDFNYVSQTNGDVQFMSTISGTNASSDFTWLFGDGTTAKGTTANHHYRTTDTAWFSAKFTVDNRIATKCRDTVTKKIKFSRDFDFSAYASHETGIFTVWLAPTSYDHIKVEVIDIWGQVVISGEPASIDSMIIDIDASSLPSAYYFLRVTTSLGTKVKKIFKK